MQLACRNVTSSQRTAHQKTTHVADFLYKDLGLLDRTKVEIASNRTYNRILGVSACLSLFGRMDLLLRTLGEMLSLTTLTARFARTFASLAVLAAFSPWAAQAQNRLDRTCGRWRVGSSLSRALCFRILRWLASLAALGSPPLPLAHRLNRSSAKNLSSLV